MRRRITSSRWVIPKTTSAAGGHRPAPAAVAQNDLRNFKNGFIAETRKAFTDASSVPVFLPPGRHDAGAWW